MPNLNLNQYANHLDLFPLSVADIESQIVQFKLQFLNIRNPQVEWKISFPIFLDSFYKFIYNKKRLPSQTEYFDYYIKNNRGWFQSNPLSDELLEGLKARLLRTYPSLIRDLHFANC